MKLLNKRTLTTILLLLLSFTVYADRFEPSDGGVSREVGGSPSSGGGLSVGSGTEGAGVSVKNENVFNGSEAVDEVSGQLSFRYTDLNFPGDGKVNLKLDRVFNRGLFTQPTFFSSNEYDPNPYQICSFWSYDLPTIKLDKQSNVTFSPSPGINIDITEAIKASVIGHLENSVSVKNAIIIENSIKPVISSNKMDFNYEGSRTLYIPQSKTIIKFGYICTSFSQWADGDHIKNIKNIKDIEIVKPNGLVYELYNKLNYTYNTKNSTLSRKGHHYFVKAITDINKQNRITFNYEEASISEYDERSGYANVDLDFNGTYNRISSIIDDKGRKFSFHYNKVVNFRERTEIIVDNSHTWVIFYFGQVKDYLSKITLNGEPYLTYEISAPKYRSYNNEYSNKNAREFYIELNAVERNIPELIYNPIGPKPNKSRIEYKYNYTTGDNYLYPNKISVIYPEGGSSNYVMNDEGKITKSILKPLDANTDDAAEYRITTYEYSTETKDTSSYLDTSVNYGKTEIFTGSYISNTLKNINKKEIYYEYEGAAKDKKSKGVALNILSVFNGNSFQNKSITKNTYTKICDEYYLPSHTINYTGTGIKKSEQYINYDHYGNTTQVDDYTKNIGNESINDYHTTTYLNYLHQNVNDSHIWNNNVVYDSEVGKHNDELRYNKSIDLVLTSYRANAEATNSITIKPRFKTDGRSFHAKLVNNYGLINSTVKPAPISMNAIVETQVIDNSNNNSVRTAFKYDNRLNKTEESVFRIENGNSIEIKSTYEYDSSNNMIKLTDAKGNTTNISRIIETNPIHKGPYSGLYAGEKVTATTTHNQNIITSTKEYDSLGRLVKEYILDSSLSTEEQLHPLTYTYDQLDRITSVQQNGEVIQQVFYDRNNQTNTIESYDTEGNYTIKKYDGLNRIILEESAIPRNPGFTGIDIVSTTSNSIKISSTNTEYHPIFTDKATKTIVNDSSNNPKLTVNTEYDYLGRIRTTKTNNIITSKKYYYDEDNFIINIDYLTTDPNPNRKVSYTQVNKDWRGNDVDILQSKQIKENLVKDDANKVHTKFEYDGFGNKTKMYLAYGTPEQQEFNYKYDNLGQLLETIYPEGTSEKFEYDNLGQVVKSYDRAGNYSTVEYNSLKLPSIVRFYDAFGSEQSNTEFLYNAQGNPVSILEKDSSDNVLNEYKYTYNRYGYLTNENKVINSGSTTKSFNIGRTYDKLGIPNKLTFTTNGYSKEINYILPYTNTSSAPENKNWIKDSLGNNIATYSFNNWGAIDSITYGTSLVTSYSAYDTLLRPVSIVSSNSGVQLLNQTYSYDLTGNVLSYSDGTYNNTYTYDGLNRLLTENDYTYSYDDLNNRTGLYTGGNSFPQLSKSYKYDSFNTNKMMLDEVHDSTNSADNVTYSYDANGNIVKKSQSSTTWDYIYDTQNQLIEVKKDSASIAKYRYDSNGHRVYKLENNIETYYVYDGNNIIYEESNGVATPSVIGNRIFNVIFNQNNIAKYINDDLQFHLLDNLGSRKLTTDSTGTPINDSNLNYSAFGGLLSGSSDNYNFTGKQLDTNTDLVYFNARFYDPAIGRFITEDPIKDGLNWYVYCNNNPVKFIDPTGLIYGVMPITNPFYSLQVQWKTFWAGIQVEMPNPFWIIKVIDNPMSIFPLYDDLQAAKNDLYYQETFWYKSEEIEALGKSPFWMSTGGVFVDTEKREIGTYGSLQYGLGFPNLSIAIEAGMSQRTNDIVLGGLSGDIGFNVPFSHNSTFGIDTLWGSDGFNGFEAEICWSFFGLPGFDADAGYSVGEPQTLFRY